MKALREVLPWLAAPVVLIGLLIWIFLREVTKYLIWLVGVPEVDGR